MFVGLFTLLVYFIGINCLHSVKGRLKYTSNIQTAVKGAFQSGTSLLKPPLVHGLPLALVMRTHYEFTHHITLTTLGYMKNICISHTAFIPSMDCIKVVGVAGTEITYSIIEVVMCAPLIKL